MTLQIIPFINPSQAAIIRYSRPVDNTSSSQTDRRERKRCSYNRFSVGSEVTQPFGLRRALCTQQQWSVAADNDVT